MSSHTQNSQETNINASGGIQTRSPSKLVAADPCLRPLGHWDPQNQPAIQVANVASGTTLMACIFVFIPCILIN